MSLRRPFKKTHYFLKFLSCLRCSTIFAKVEVSIYSNILAHENNRVLILANESVTD